MFYGGDEKRSGYVRYLQGIQPNIPACTTFIDINGHCVINYYQGFRVIYMLTLHALTKVPLSSAHTRTFFQQPLFYLRSSCCSLIIPHIILSHFCNWQITLFFKMSAKWKIANIKFVVQNTNNTSIISLTYCFDPW